MNNGAKKTLKFFLYFFGKLLAAAIVLAAAWFVFRTALNTSNVQVIVKDAFSKRASVILEPLDNPDTELLSKVFTPSYLRKSRLDVQQDNQYYKVTLFSQRTDVDTVLVFPAATEVEVVVTDVIEDVRATLVNEDAADFVAKDSLMDSGVYRVKVIKTEEHGWLIDDIVLEEEVIPEIIRELPTPAPSEQTEE